MAFGSPPRVWGQLILLLLFHHPLRFTPTCVGTTPPRTWLQRGRPVHPHVCGDNSFACASEPAETGSPPRVWGQLTRPSQFTKQRRFTPTCVGTTGGVLFHSPNDSVHPHVCGDNLVECRMCQVPVGSPPRVWGQRAGYQWGSRNRRFTPTCVGTTIAVPHRDPSAAVHPHVCGDNIALSSVMTVMTGSPPRVWGQH